jgi:hypothetical protein
MVSTLRSQFRVRHVNAFICVVAIGNAGSSKVEDQLQSLGDNFVWIQAGSRARNGMQAGARGSRTLVLSDAHAIVEQVPLIKSMSPNVDGHVQVISATVQPFGVVISQSSVSPARRM